MPPPKPKPLNIPNILDVVVQTPLIPVLRRSYCMLAFSWYWTLSSVRSVQLLAVLSIGALSMTCSVECKLSRQGGLDSTVHCWLGVERGDWADFWQKRSEALSDAFVEYIDHAIADSRC